jgi:hypothetical protein
MEAKNEVSVQKIQVVSLENISDLEELEGRNAPCALWHCPSGHP